MDRKKDDMPVYDFQLPEQPCECAPRLTRRFSFPALPDLPEKKNLPLNTEESFLSPERLSMLLAPSAVCLTPQNFLGEELQRLSVVKPTPALLDFPKELVTLPSPSPIPSPLLNTSDPALLSQLVKLLPFMKPLNTSGPLSTLSVPESSEIPKNPAIDMLSPGFSWNVAQTPLLQASEVAKDQKLSMLKPPPDLLTTRFSASIPPRVPSLSHQSTFPSIPQGLLSPPFPESNAPPVAGVSPRMPLLPPVSPFPNQSVFPSIPQQVTPSRFPEPSTLPIDLGNHLLQNTSVTDYDEIVRLASRKRQRVEVPLGPEIPMPPGSPFQGYKDEKRSRRNGNSSASSSVWEMHRDY